MLLIAAGLAACVHIETASETPEQLSESSALRGKQFRVDWIDRFTGLSSREKAESLVTLIDSLGGQFLRYGRQVVNEWRDGNDARGQYLPDSEMRQMIEAGNKSQWPLFTAYEEVMEYSLAEIRRIGAVDEATADTLKEHVDLYYRVFSDVMYPNGTVDDYQYRLLQDEGDLEDHSRVVREEISRY